MVVAVGVTCCEPLAETVPMPPSIVTVVAFVVCQVNVADWPALTVVGLAVKDAVGVPPPDPGGKGCSP